MLIEVFSLGVTAQSLRAKKDRTSAILLQCGHFDPKFQIEGIIIIIITEIFRVAEAATPPRGPPIIFERLVRPMNALQLCR